MIAWRVSVFFFLVNANSSCLSRSYRDFRVGLDQLRLLPADRLGVLQRETGQRIFVRLEVRTVVEDKHLFGAEEVLDGESEVVGLEERQVGLFSLFEKGVEAEEAEGKLGLEFRRVVDVFVLGLVQSVHSQVAASEHLFDCVSGGYSGRRSQRRSRRRADSRR